VGRRRASCAPSRLQTKGVRDTPIRPTTGPYRPCGETVRVLGPTPVLFPGRRWIRIREAGSWRRDRIIRLNGRAPWSTRHGTSRGVWRLNLVHPRSAPDSAPIHQAGPGSQICLRMCPQAGTRQLNRSIRLVRDRRLIEGSSVDNLAEVVTRRRRSATSPYEPSKRRQRRLRPLTYVAGRSRTTSSSPAEVGSRRR
jgi:hypothetical protein